MDRTSSGYEELEHTADWALRVWSADLPGLFAAAAQGMYALMETTLLPGERLERAFSLKGPDCESLLVAFLSELLYDGESQGAGYDEFQITLAQGSLAAESLAAESLAAESLSARLKGARIVSQNKEIKAVTFHNLNVQFQDGVYRVTIVFDV